MKIQMNEGTRLLEKRQHGMMKCKICGKKMKRLPSNVIYSKVIDGVLHSTIIHEYTGYYFIDMHRKCWENNHTQEIERKKQK